MAKDIYHLDKLDQYRDLIYKILSYYGSLPYRYAEINNQGKRI